MSLPNSWGLALCLICQWWYTEGPSPQCNSWLIKRHLENVMILFLLSFPLFSSWSSELFFSLFSSADLLDTYYKVELSLALQNDSSSKKKIGPKWQFKVCWTQEHKRTSAKALGEVSEVSEVTTIARGRTLSYIIPDLSCVQQPTHLISNLHLNNRIELLDKADKSLRAKWGQSQARLWT